MLDGKNAPEGLEEWLESGTTGASARSIAAHLASHGEQNGDYPRDAGDFQRCERLLDMVPSLRSDLPRMAEVNAYWAVLVKNWDAIRSSADQGGTIRAMIRPIQDEDPCHIDIDGNTSIGFGANIFKGIRDGSEDSDAPRMKETDADRAVRDTAYRVTASELRQFIERFERLEAEKKDIADQQKEVMAEAKGRGYDTKVMRKVISLRKRDRDDIAEEEAVLEMYKEALGM